jgi:hypothetical protein
VEFILTHTAEDSRAPIVLALLLRRSWHLAFSSGWVTNCRFFLQKIVRFFALLMARIGRVILLPSGLFINGTPIDQSFNYFNPPDPFQINGVSDPTSQRFVVGVLFPRPMYHHFAQLFDRITARLRSLFLFPKHPRSHSGIFRPHLPHPTIDLLL